MHSNFPIVNGWILDPMLEPIQYWIVNTNSSVLIFHCQNIVWLKFWTVLVLLCHTRDEEAEQTTRKKSYMLRRKWFPLRESCVFGHGLPQGFSPVWFGGILFQSSVAWPNGPNYKHLDRVYLFTCNIIRPCNKQKGTPLPVFAREHPVVLKVGCVIFVSFT